MRLIVNGESWVLHFRHANVGFSTRTTQAWLHRGDCVIAAAGLKDCAIETTDAAIFVFPTNVFRRRATFVHGYPVAIKERWSMPFSRAVGRREALTRLLFTMFPTRGPSDDRTTRAAFWEAYWAINAYGLDGAKARQRMQTTPRTGGK